MDYADGSRRDGPLLPDEVEARLVQRLACLEKPMQLEIAYACGFRDYTHFARKFRRRFGYPPGKTGAYSVGPETVRAGTDESAP